MSRGPYLAALVLAGLAAPIVLAMTATTGTGADDLQPCAPGQVGEVDGLDDEQTRNADIIVAVGQAVGVPEFGLQIALATAMQESSLRNLYYGDRDSLGLFQQRPSTGWGTPAQVTDPVYAAQAFYGGPTGPNRGEPPGLLDVAGWQHMSLTDAAQEVQRSAFPQAYAQWETSTASWLVDLQADSGPSCAQGGDWVVPLAGDYTITARFGDTGAHWSTNHTGVDLGAPIGRDVLAASGGEVSYADWDGPYGLKVEITHPDGTRTWYAHLSAITATEGTMVGPGDVIGHVGATGNVTGPHLHFEVRPGPVDPEPWMAARGAAL